MVAHREKNNSQQTTNEHTKMQTVTLNSHRNAGQLQILKLKNAMKYEIYAHDFQRSFETLPKFILFGRAIPPYDVHAFPKVATLPDTEPKASQSQV